MKTASKPFSLLAGSAQEGPGKDRRGESADGEGGRSGDGQGGADEVTVPGEAVTDLVGEAQDPLAHWGVGQDLVSVADYAELAGTPHRQVVCGYEVGPVA